MLQQLRLFFVALQFLTRLPTPAWVGFEPAWLNASARYFPMVGTVVGVVAAGVIWASGLLFPPLVAAGLSIAATLLLTGAFHEDGLADTCDALGGAVDRQRALEIMKDSRIGSYGAVGLIGALGLKAATLGSLAVGGSTRWAVLASIAAHTLSRAVPVLLIRRLRYAGDASQAKAKPLAQGASTAEVGVALAWSALVGGGCLIVAPERTVAVAVAVSALHAALLTVVSARWLEKRLGGYTGDTLGAAQQIGELLTLLIWLAAVRWPLAS